MYRLPPCLGATPTWVNRNLPAQRVTENPACTHGQRSLTEEFLPIIEGILLGWMGAPVGAKIRKWRTLNGQTPISYCCEGYGKEPSIICTQGVEFPTEDQVYRWENVSAMLGDDAGDLLKRNGPSSLNLFVHHQLMTKQFKHTLNCVCFFKQKFGDPHIAKARNSVQPEP